MGQVADGMKAKLEAAFAPQSLEIRDDSALHAGHAGAPAGGESHFTVEIVSTAFDGQNRLARHRAVNEVLAAELAGPVHALVVKARAPGDG